MVTLLLLMMMHFISDFLLQSRHIATTKSSSWLSLGVHVAIIYTCFLPFGIFFAFFNAVIHGIIDRYVWQLYKYSVKIRHGEVDPATYKYYEDSFFYDTIGFDQMLHVGTLIALAYELGIV